MTDPAFMDDEEAALLRRLEEIRKQKQQLIDEKWERIKAEEEAYKYVQDAEDAYEEYKAYVEPIVIDSFSIVSNRLHFKIHLPTKEIPYNLLRILRDCPTRVYNYESGTNSVEVKDWKPLEVTMKEVVKNLVINYEQDFIPQLDAYKEPPDWTVKMDSRSMLVYKGPKAKGWIIQDSIPSATFNTLANAFRVPFVDAYKLINTLKDCSVTYSEDAEKFIENEVNKRANLDIVAKKEKTDIVIPLREGMKLKDFQAVSVEYADVANGRVAINHEMGLGKTPCAIGVIEYRKTKKNLIVVPAMVKPNWVREIYKFSTGGSIYELSGEVPGNFDIAQVLAGGHRWYIISYDSVGSKIDVPAKEWVENGQTIRKEAHVRYPWVEILNAGNFECIVLDEAHYIKNIDSHRSHAVRMLQSRDIIPLTGTPILNRPQELWALLSVIDKDVAGPYETFVKQYTYNGKDVRNVDELREIMRPYMFRKIKKDVLPELPPINRITREFQLSGAARKRYDKVLAGIYEEIDKWSGDTNPIQINSILAQLIRMKQVCAEDKVEYVADLATQLYDESTDLHKKIIICSQFSENPPMVAEIRKRLGREALSFTGSDSPSDRQAIVDKFCNDDQYAYLVMSIKAGGIGLNITAAGSIIFPDFTWTPADHHQAEARAYGRLSDLHSINSYYIVAVDTIEEDIMALLAKKLDIINAVVEGAELSRGDGSIAMELIRKLKGL